MNRKKFSFNFQAQEIAFEKFNDKHKIFDNRSLFLCKILEENTSNQMNQINCLLI